MKIIRALFFLGLWAFLGWAGYFCYHSASDGFNFRQIHSSLPSCPEFRVALSDSKKEFLLEILDQSYTYIGKGAQFYVFGSEDGEYVIKFFKHKHLRPLTWVKHFRLPQKVYTLAEEKNQRREQRVKQLFSSCKLAYEQMEEETGVVYIHLDRHPTLRKKVTFHDKLGRSVLLEIDNHEFVIQKRAQTLEEVFAAHADQPGEIERDIESLLKLVVTRCQKGIADTDPAFVQNIAFTQDGPIFVDIGQFKQDPKILSQEEQAKDLAIRLQDLHTWTNRHFPKLLPLIKKQTG
ncbi:MAG: hypothetical protein K940chlam9_01235 [Chlamydiae bacterium]|nr:hypothetical protein [Chlamydiota bacterium]